MTLACNKVSPLTRLSTLDGYALVALFLIPAPLILPLLQPGLPNAADSFVHLFRVGAMAQALQDGVLYPRWAGDFYLGYGYPFFNFYAPGVHYLAALLTRLGFSAVTALVIVQILALSLGYGLGSYRFARTMVSPLPALVAAATYVYAPARGMELFVQANYSQLLALGILPWVAWSIARLAQAETMRQAWRWAGVLGLFFATLVYAHHPTALLAAPFLGLYALVLSPRRVLISAVGFTFGLAWSAPFWVPGLLELRNVGIQSMESGMFNVVANLVPLRELLAPTPLLDLTALNPPMPQNIGQGQVMLTLLGLLSMGWTLSKRRPSGLLTHGVFAVAAFLVAIVIMLPQAAIVWQLGPLVRFIAFPRRLIGIALLWSALLAGLAVEGIPRRWQTGATALIAPLLLLSLFPYLFPRPFVPAPAAGSAGMTAYELSGGARGTASANEYLPRWVASPDPPPVMVSDLLAGRTAQKLDAGSLPPGATFRVLEHAANRDRFELDTPVSASPIIRTFFFPGWQAWLDGKPAPIRPAGPYGLIQTDVPAGQHTLEVRFGETPERQLGWALAALATVAALALMWASRQKASTDVGLRQQFGETNWQSLVLAATPLLLLIVLKVTWIEPSTHWFRPQSSPDQPLAMQHEAQTDFAGGLRLLGYDLEPASVKQGESITVRLYWRATQPQDADYRPYVHLDAPDGSATWANHTAFQPANGTKPTHEWVLGYYVVDEHTLSVPADAPAVPARLTIGLLRADNTGHLATLDGRSQVDLGPVRILARQPLNPAQIASNAQSYQFGKDIRLLRGDLQTDATGATVTLYWQATRPLTEDYAVFAHLMDAQGQTVAQSDGDPVGGWFPTHNWLPNEVITDVRHIAVANPQDQPWRVAVGLYRRSDGQRLPVRDSRGQAVADDSVVMRNP